ncbi:MAG TPA: hypothetical protein VNO52_02625 [Methylomirabilota bacterium]|nr:hypothetical protein [Methylomirabilota bacterium]
MKRRQFIGWGVGMVAALTGAACLAPEWLRRRAAVFISRGANADDRRVARALRAAFLHLDIEPEAVDRFIADYRRVYGLPFELPLDDSIKRIFLLSTDFIQHDADESRRLRYVTIYSPYDNPCYNPFTLRRWSHEG